MSEQTRNFLLCPTFGPFEAELLMTETNAEARRSTEDRENSVDTTPWPSPAKAREGHCGEAADSAVPPFAHTKRKSINRRDFVQARGRTQSGRATEIPFPHLSPPRGLRRRPSSRADPGLQAEHLRDLRRIPN